MLELNKIYQGDCLEVMKEIPDNSIDTIITDPPYGLEFMGKNWDKFKAGKNIAGGTTGLNTPFGRKRALPSFYQLSGNGYYEFSFKWAKEALRVAKPGATLLCFGGTRTWYRLACAIEDAGWIIKDTIMWLYGSGFPKATDISKQIDKMKGAGKDRKFGRCGSGIYQMNVNNPNKMEFDKKDKPVTPDAKLWNGWKSHGLKPAYEPIIMAMKPNEGSYAENALKWEVAGLNIDGGRIEFKSEFDYKETTQKNRHKDFNSNNGIRVPTKGIYHGDFRPPENYEPTKGRFPSNVILECTCDKVIEGQETTKEPEEVKGGIWRKSKGKPAGRTYKGIGTIHTNPECLCYILDKQSGIKKGNGHWSKTKVIGFGEFGNGKSEYFGVGEKDNSIGGASRFFYVAKASKSERNMGLDDFPDKIGGGMKGTEDQTLLTGAGNIRNNKMKNNHPTVKPLKLIEYLCLLTKTPTGGVILDPFAGSGTTGIACVKTGRNFILIEKEEEYVKIAEARLKKYLEQKKIITI